MKWIVITPPDFIQNEAAFIEQLFEQGLDLLHLRKPNAPVEAYHRLLTMIPIEWHSRIVLHEHFELVNDFSLYGVHLNRRCAQVPNDFKGSISRSCHSLAEVAVHKSMCNYVFLSPIFNSISKEGYEAAFSNEALQQAAAEGLIDEKVVALGGVTAQNIEQLRTWHFGGAAFLGDVWNRVHHPQFEKYLALLRAQLS